MSLPVLLQQATIQFVFFRHHNVICVSNHTWHEEMRSLTRRCYRIYVINCKYSSGFWISKISSYFFPSSFVMTSASWEEGLNTPLEVSLLIRSDRIQELRPVCCSVCLLLIHYFLLLFFCGSSSLPFPLRSSAFCHLVAVGCTLE